MSERFEHHARTVTLLTAGSRVTGLFRDAALSRVFGAGGLMDAFWFAFMIPNLFRRLFGEGALSAAFLPVYAQLDKNDPKVAKQLATMTISLMIVALGGVTLLGEMILFTLSLRAGHDHLAITLMMIMLPYMPLVCLVAVMGSMLHVHKRFGPTAAAPVILNLFLIVTTVCSGMLFVNLTHQVTLVATSVIAAGLLQIIWSLAALRSHQWWVGISNRTAESRAAVRRVLSHAWPMFIGLGVLQLNTFLDGLIASYPTTVGPTIFGFDFPLEEGALASISFAHRLYEFPLGVFGIAIATAIFPTLSAAADDDEAFMRILRRGLRLVIYIGLPASVGLILVREPLTAAVLQGKNFSAEDSQRVAFILMGYASAVWAYSMIHVLTRAFYARGDSKSPVKVAVSMVALNLALNCTLIWTPLREAGLAWSTAICSFLQAIVLLRLARKHSRNLLDREVKTSWLKTCGVSAIMCAGVVIAISLLPDRNPTWTWAVIQLAILVSVGGAVVVVTSLMMRLPELSWALGRTSS